MPLENPYCTLAAVQRETGNSDPEIVSWLQDCINQASRYIDMLTQRDFLPHYHTAEPYIPKPSQIAGKVITLPWPILELEELKVKGITFPEQYYEYEGRTISLTRSDKATYPTVAPYVTFVTPGNPIWNKTKNAIEIYGVFGYEADEDNEPDSWCEGDTLTRPPLGLPAGLQRACTLIASAWSNEKRRERMSQDGQRVSLLDVRIPEEAAALLRRFTPIQF